MVRGCLSLHTGVSGPDGNFSCSVSESPHCVGRWATRLRKLVISSEDASGSYYHYRKLHKLGRMLVQKNAATLQHLECFSVSAGLLRAVANCRWEDTLQSSVVPFSSLFCCSSLLQLSPHAAIE